MKDEIREGVEFLRLFLAKFGQLTQTQIDIFAVKLTNLLEKRYINHWHKENPIKGQAFRCLRLKHSENYIDPVLDQLLKELNLSLNQLGLPNDFTLWIDPGEVSVRFGDQPGYTFSIARLDKDSQNLRKDGEPNSNCLTESKIESSTLIVENSAKIFDEKLTAFIRQNSCSTKENMNSNEFSTINSVDFNNNNNNFDFDDMSSITDDLALTIQENDFNKMLNQLSAEKRTISPPVSPNKSSSIVNTNTNMANQRANSSNINIQNNNSSKFSKKNTTNYLNSLINNNNNNINNRLSYNDSCYYSSSSSSCSSSFESNHHEDFGGLNWIKSSFEQPKFKMSNNNSYNQLTSLINNNNSSLLSNNNANINNDDFDFINQQNLFSNSFLIETQPIDVNKNTNLKTNFATNNYDLFDPINNTNRLIGGQTNNNYSLNYNYFGNFSETSSDRSDTPNSCITTASSTSYFMTPSPSSLNNFTNTNNNNLLNDNYVKQLNKLSINEEINNNSSSSSSSSSDSTTVGSNNVPESSTEKSTENSNNKNNDEVSTLTASSPTSSEKSESNNKEKKEEKYCGYVESFPYYYKLNRLYNALAVQKMQTERLRKSAIINNQTILNQNTPAAIAAALAALSTSPNAATIGQAQLRSLSRNGAGTNSSSTTSPVAASPSNYTSSLATTPPPQSIHHNGSKPSVLNSSSSNGLNNMIGNNNNNNTRPNSLFASAQGNGHKWNQLNSNNNRANNTINRNGYPMSPTNAAISFANHQNKSNRNNFNQNNNMKMVNQNKSKMMQQNNSNNSFGQYQLNVQQNQQQFHQQQSQLINQSQNNGNNNSNQQQLFVNQFYSNSSQMNHNINNGWNNRGQDLLKS